MNFIKKLKSKRKTYKITSDQYMEYLELKKVVETVVNDKSIPFKTRQRLIHQIGKDNFGFMYKKYWWIGKRNANI